MLSVIPAQRLRRCRWRCELLRASKDERPRAVTLRGPCFARPPTGERNCVRPGGDGSVLMQRGRIELVLDALEVIEPLDRVIEFGAFFLGEIGFHAGDGV